MSRFYFYDKGSEMCLTLDSIKDKIHDEGLTEKQVFEAERLVGDDYFYCREYGEMGERGNCSGCEKYKPRNGHSGICEHWGYTYGFGKEVVITLTD